MLCLKVTSLCIKKRNLHCAFHFAFRYIKYLDSVCEKLQEFIACGFLPRSHIFYKLIRNAVDFVSSVANSYKDFEWDETILEFVDSLEYYGHQATVNMLQGQEFHGKTKGDARLTAFDWKTWNWPLPGKTTRQIKNKGRYCTKSGIYWNLHESFLLIVSSNLKDITPFIDDETSHLMVFAATNQEDGMALKPGLQVDSHQGRAVGCTFPIDILYIKNNPEIDKDTLKEGLVKEAHCLQCLQTLDGKFAFPVSIEYLRSSVTGEEQLISSTSNMQNLPCCLNCLKTSKMQFQGAVMTGLGQCNASCDKCLQEKDVCNECAALGHKFTNPALRACSECIENEQKCIKVCLLSWIIDCESKNKKSLQLFQTEKASNEVNQALSLVSPLPDAVRVAKLDRASFANWFRFVDRYRVNLVLLRTCRLDPIMKDQLTPSLSLASCRNRDRMIEICSEDVCTVVSAISDEIENIVFDMLLPKTKPILVGFLYRPPDQSKFLDKLSTAISRSNTFDNQEVYILGDFNINLMNKQKHIPNGIKRYKEFCSLYGLEQLISTPTRVTMNSSSTLDHILTNSTDRVSQSGVIDTGLSDHQLIYCTRKITRTKFNSHKNITIRSLKNYSQDVYLEELNKINFPDYSKFTDINDAYSDFIGKVSSTIDKIAPMKGIRIKNSSKEWFDEEILEEIEKRDKLLAKFKKSR